MDNKGAIKIGLLTVILFLIIILVVLAGVAYFVIQNSSNNTSNNSILDQQVPQVENTVVKEKTVAKKDVIKDINMVDMEKERLNKDLDDYLIEGLDSSFSSIYGEWTKLLYNQNLLEKEPYKFEIVWNSINRAINVYNYGWENEPEESKVTGHAAIRIDGMKEAYNKLLGIEFNELELTNSKPATFVKIENGKVIGTIATAQTPIVLQLQTSKIQYNETRSTYIVTADLLYDKDSTYTSLDNRVDFDESKKVCEVEIQYTLDSIGNKIFKSITLSK